MSEAVKENEHEDDLSVPIEELQLEPQAGQMDELSHLLELAHIGAANPCASSGEKRAARLAQCVVDNVPGLDARAVNGLCEFIRLASQKPDTAGNLIRPSGN